MTYWGISLCGIAVHQSGNVPSDSIANSSSEALKAAVKEAVDCVLFVEGVEIVG